MSLETLSRSEVLDRAAELRASGEEGLPRVFSPEEGEILRQADLIANERRSSGISGVIESALAATRGERASAELALQKARQREAEVESLLQKKAGLEKGVASEKNALANIKRLIADYKQRTTPEAERSAMLSRFWARHEARFAEHLIHAVAGIAEARLIAAALPTYEEMSRAEIAKLEAEVADIERKISKARK